MKEGAALTHTSVLPILASSRKGTPHAASPPEVNAPTTPNTLPSLALTFSQVLSHIGMEVGDGEPISRLRYPPPEVAHWPAFSPLLFLSLSPAVSISLFSSSPGCFPGPPAPSRPLPMLCAGENPILHKHSNPNWKSPFVAPKQTLCGLLHQGFLLLPWFGERRRNQGHCEAVGSLVIYILRDKQQ